MTRSVSAIVCAAACAAPVLAQPRSVAEIAPPETIALVAIDDFARARAAWDESAFSDLYADPEIKGWMERAMEEVLRELREELEKVNAELKDIPLPTGLAGVSFWWGVDPDTQSPMARMFAVAEFADEDEAADLEALMEEMLDQRDEEGEISLEPREVAGLEIWTLTLSEEVAEEDEWDDGEETIPRDVEFFLGRFESYLFFASDTGVVERVVDILDGERLPSLAENAAYGEGLRAIGASHLHVAGFLEPFVEVMNFVYDNAAEWSMVRQIPMAPGGLVSALGLDELKAGVMGVELGGEHLGATKLSVVAPERRGLLTLFTQPVRFEAPGFVGADAASLGLFSIDFSRLLPLARDIIALMPDPDRTQALGFIEGFAPLFEPALRSLGPEIMVVNTIERPFAWDSEQALVAIRARDTQTINGMLTQFGPMTGLKARDFQGAQIWETPAMAAGVEAPVLGVGSGYLFYGQAPEVENALRTAEAEGAPRIEGEASFQRARGAVRREGAAFEYTDMRKTLDYTIWMYRNQVDVTMAMIRSMWGEEMPAEELAAVREEVEADTPDWLKDLPPAEVWMKHFGDTITEGYWTDRGFFSATYLLAPRKE